MEVLKQKMQQLQPILEARAEDFTAFAALAHAAATSGQLPELSQVPQQVLITGGCATVLVLLMLLPRGRRLLWETADTVLATIAAIALLVVLIVTLLSVPVGERRSHLPMPKRVSDTAWYLCLHSSPCPSTQ